MLSLWLPYVYSFISYTYRFTIMAKRKDLDDFQYQTRCFYNLIRANHHLEKVQRSPTELPAPKFLKIVKGWLSQTIRPANPNDYTAVILNANAGNWLQTALQILTEHHSTTISNLKEALAPFLGGNWEDAWSTATKWITKKYPYIRESLFQLTLDDLKRSVPYPPVIEPALPPRKRQNTNPITNQSPPGLRYQSDPQGQPGVSANPLVTDGPPSQGTPKGSPDLFPDSLSLPPGQLQGMHKDLLSPVIAPLPSRIRAVTQVVLQIQTKNPNQNINTTADLSPKANHTAVEHLPQPGHSPQLPQTKTNTPPGRSRPLSFSDFELSPSPPLDQYTHHAHKGDKNKNWVLNPTRKTIIMGDSNIARLPAILDEWIQVDCFPGANLAQALHLLKHKTPTSDVVERVILSFGINDKHRGNASLLDGSLRKLWQAAKATFPNAQIHIPVINTSNGLSVTHRSNMSTLNQLIKRIPSHIPRLSNSQFHTETDNIHWTTHTGRDMWNHWRSFLCQGIQHQSSHQ